MSRIFWACWDGGGNLTPSLGIATELERRGHTVYFHGRPDMVSRVEAAGLRASVLERSYDQLDRYSFHPLATVFGYTSSPAVGREVADRVAADEPDLVVIDAMFAAALEAARRFERPSAVMLHTFCYRLIDMWRGNFAMQSESRQKAGFEPLSGGPDELWGSLPLLHVNTLAAFDGPATVGWANIVHGAPVLNAERRAVPAVPTWPVDDATPVVLLSFSTVAEQRDVDMLQRALDALAPLPVRVVATTGAIVDPAEMSPPANAWLIPFADHDALMARATMVLGHGGHGTTMRALRHGLPIVGIPAKGGDQAPILATIEQWGAGLALPGDAGMEEIRAAVVRVLGQPAFGQESRRRSAAFGPGLTDGATLAADSLERLLDARFPPPRS